MTRLPDPKPRFLGLAPGVAATLIIAATTLLRFFYSAWLPILPDEAYYFQWSRHLDASYISKGPAVAYTIAAGTGLFGGGVFGVRFFAVLLSAGTAWQLYLLARRWYDEVTGLIAVLVAGVVPLYAVGAIVMTIDPLSAFFWVWAANFFSRAVQTDRLDAWAMAASRSAPASWRNISTRWSSSPSPRSWRWCRRGGWRCGAAGSGSCSRSPRYARRRCSWWNAQHGWISWGQLLNRGHLGAAQPFTLRPGSFLGFLLMQAVVISPWLFVALLASAGIAIQRRFRRRDGELNEGEFLLFLLFVPVFGMYALLSWHLQGEPNWPAVSYLGLIVILASHWRKMLAARPLAQPFIIIAWGFAWLQTLIMHDPEILQLPAEARPDEPRRRLVADRRASRRAEPRAAYRRAHRRRVQGGQRAFLRPARAPLYLHAAPPAAGQPVRPVARLPEGPAASRALDHRPAGARRAARRVQLDHAPGAHRRFLSRPCLPGV
ncbi:MAG: glycosyltransferase family 39 protein [Verrucomicrobiota bacterium]